MEEDLAIYRLPGDKLGLGLRFDGGSKASEYVHRLFVQSCAPNSPAARTKCTWGYLSEGDEVISISGKIVKRMTRVDCVKALKGKNNARKSYVKWCTLGWVKSNPDYSMFFDYLFQSRYLIKQSLYLGLGLN